MEQKNDWEIMQEFYHRYRQNMYHVAYMILRDPYDAEDAVQDAFVKLFRGEKGIPDPASGTAKSFALTAVKSAALDVYRKKRKESERFVLVDRMPERGDPSGVPEAEMSEMGLAKLIRGLPERYRTVLDCRFLRELSVRDTSHLLGIGEAAVRKRQERGLKMLRERIGGVSYEKS